MYRSISHYIYIAFLLNGLVFSASAQTLSSPFITTTYTSQDGLPHSYIYSILQDNKGYLWVGTRYGLSRFDGLGFSSITCNDEVKNIPSGSLVEDESGRLSILSPGEIYFLDNKKKLGLLKKGPYFPVFKIPGNKKSTKDDLWTIEKDDIYPLNAVSSKRITPVPGMGKKICRQIFETDSGWYYNFLNDFFFAGKDGKIQDIGKLLPARGFIVVMGFRNDEFYLYSDRGVYAYANNRIRPLFQKQLSGKHIYAVYRDKKNRLWVGTREDGIMIAQPGQEEILSYSIKLSHNLISGFYEDKEGNIWIAGFEGLIKVQEKKYEAFSGKQYPYLTDLNLIAKDREGAILFFSEEKGFSTWHQGKFSFQSGNPGTGQLIDALCRDDKDRFWCISRQNRLILYHHGQIRFINDPVLKTAGDLQPGIVYDNYRKKTWVPGEKLLVGDEKGFEIYKDKNNRSIQDPGRLLMTGDGKIIVSTLTNELLLIDRNNRIRKVSVPKNLFPERIHSFFLDSSANIWISYPGTGLLQCHLLQDSSLSIVNQFTKENGLNNDVIQSMAFDKQHRIWLSTMAGITVIDFKNKTKNSFPVYVFGKEEGIPASGLEYGRILCDDNGDMWYSTQHALMKFPVSQMDFNNMPPYVNIEEVRLNMKETNWHAYSDSLSGIFQLPVNPVMNYDENTITIIFKAVTMNNAENIQYSYLLKGLNNDWSTSSPGNTITFSKLKPGSYTFFVRARKNNFDWGTPVMFAFSIRQPFWQQWWFIIIVFFACFGNLYWFFRFRFNQLNKEKQIRDQIASDLHDDLGSTLNSVKVYANVASMEKDNKQYLEKIKESTQEAITSVRDIIWVLDEKKDKMEHLVTRISQFALPLCGAKHIQFVQEIDDPLYNYVLGREEKRNLFMIMKEAVNNSIKYADCKKIAISVTEEKGKLAILITDDGKGYIADTSTEGHGIRNILRRASEIHYRAKITSPDGKGTTIRLEKK